MRIDRFLRHLVYLLGSVCLLLALAGCAATRERHTSASVVDFLYPDAKEPVVAPAVPILTLPLHVGIAFVPSKGYGSPVLTEQRKTQLLQQVAEHFRPYPYVKDIEIIPSAYLKPQGGFTNLDQIRTMYGIDVVALVSYDQMQFTDEGILSLTYWTIVGAYVVPGEKNDTQTMLDTVVLDIRSRKMLFRAPGASHVKASATLVNVSEQLRHDSESSFDDAAQQMIVNLDQQLNQFKEKIKERPDEYQVVRGTSYSGRTGAGGLDAAWLVLFAVLARALLWRGRGDS
jgi:rhombotail lipoprotein